MSAVTWEDFPVGRTITTHGLTVTEAHLVQWAGLTGDWYPLHMDATFAERTRFGERIAHGPLVFAWAVGLLGLTGWYGEAIIAWLGLDRLRATAPVRIGDTIRVEARVKESRLTSSGTAGVVVLACCVRNQDGVDVMSFEHSLMMEARQEAEP
jgi:acyl dehydratase